MARPGSLAFAEGTCRPSPVRQIAASYVRQGKLIPLHTLITNFWLQNDLAAAIQAGSAVQYLYSRFGVNAVHALWRDGAQSLPIVARQPRPALRECTTIMLCPRVALLTRHGGLSHAVLRRSLGASPLRPTSQNSYVAIPGGVRRRANAPRRNEVPIQGSRENARPLSRR